jgi:hypothetical protein
MAVAEDLLPRHIATFIADNVRWQMMLADDVVWELPFAPALGHPARVSGRADVVLPPSGRRENRVPARILRPGPRCQGSERVESGS